MLMEPSDMAVLPALGGSGVIPNVAATRALPLMSPGTQLSVMDPTLYLTSVMEASAGKIERTGRGGLHVIMSQVNGVPNRGAQVQFLPLTIRNYIAAHPNNKYGMWQWIRLTRAAQNTASPIQTTTLVRSAVAGFPGQTQQNATLMLNYGDNGTWFNPGGASDYLTLNRPFAKALGNVRPAVAVKGGWSLNVSGPGNTVPATGDEIRADYNMGTLGGSGNNSLVANQNAQPSQILYRLYFEDLTVSGRTVAAVDALDATAFSTAFAIGGRFYNDTFTDPATLP